MPILEKAILLFLLLFIPSQLGYHFWPSWSLVNGVRVDYLSPTLFFSDVLILILLALSKSFKTPPLLLMVVVVINSLFALSPPPTFFLWFRVVEYSMLVAYLLKNNLVVTKLLLYSLPISLIVVSVLAWMQFVSQSSVGGMWYFFGEREFSLITPGIAKIQLGNHGLFLRTYSMFSHPNSLAGFLLVSITLLKHLRSTTESNPWKGRFHWVPHLVTTASYLTIIFTFSRTIIFLTIAVLLLEKTWQKMIYHKKAILLVFASLALIATIIINSSSPRSISDRLQLQQKSLTLISNRPVLGVGLGGYVISQKQVVNSTTLNLAYQPVHNIYLLLMAELGIPLFLLVVVLVIKSTVNHPPPFYLGMCFVIILASGYVDHYWLTLHQNQLLLLIIVGLYLSKVKSTHEPT